MEAHTQKPGLDQTVRYAYAPFDRKIDKTDRFVWDGNRLLGEQRGGLASYYIYEQDGFTPVAHIQGDDLDYYHNDHLGTPRELTDRQGETVWEAVYQAWGNIVKIARGQYHDSETGLHYNRFRYYDPDIARFVSQDPIGLFGGENLYQYAPNPVGWVDPLGLAGHKFKYGIHGVAPDYETKGLHGGYGGKDKIELKFLPAQNGGITCKCVFSKDNNKIDAVKKAKEEALNSLKNTKIRQKALHNLEGAKEYYDKAGKGREWRELKLALENHK